MKRSQARSFIPDAFSIRTERLGPLPLINHFLDQLGLEDMLERFVPTKDRRVKLSYAKRLGVLLRSILVEREPIYRQQETVSTFVPEAFGIPPDLVGHIGDDAIGRALDKLFDADRGTLLTEVVVAAGKAFDLRFDELHNDSTTVKFCGQYAAAKGRSIRGKRGPYITYGFSKDHRPDLKQLLFILTATSDGGVPIQFRREDGNQNDDPTHIETWNTLCRITGQTGFLYTADSKLCNREAMLHIDRQQGRFVCVMPRTRREDKIFREWIQTHTPDWTLAIDRRNPRRRHGPRDRWWVFRDRLPSGEGWPVTWVYSELLARRQQQSRQDRIARATQYLEDYNARLAGPRPRRRSRKEILYQVESFLRRRKVGRYVHVRVVRAERERFKQVGPGRPGPKTRYRRDPKKFWRLEWELDEDRIVFDQKSDGMYPLLSNDRDLAAVQVLEAHKRQPTIEKRFEQTKTVFEIAPVFLKNEGRIEALFYLYALALLVQALIERELRRAMERESIEELPLYPEERQCRRPTAEQIFRLFSLAGRHSLKHKGEEVRTFHPELTTFQKQILELLGVPAAAYRTAG